jgi:hypothetical protein
MTLAPGAPLAATIVELRVLVAFPEACLDANAASNAAHIAWHAAVGQEAAAETKFIQKLSDIRNIKSGNGLFSSSSFRRWDQICSCRTRDDVSPSGNQCDIAVSMSDPDEEEMS